MKSHSKRTKEAEEEDDNGHDIQRKRSRIDTTSANTPGKVYIASMNLRGKWAEKPADVDVVLNVTSAQGKDNVNRLAFSPMTPVSGGYKGYWNFEHYWQSGKVFEGIDPDKSRRWWRQQTQPKRRYPPGKGKRVLHAIFDDVSDKPLDYIPSRKLVYVPQYAQLIEQRDALQYWRSQLQAGHNIIVYDFDGPRLENGDVTSELCTLELLRTKINDTRHPFGHGYVVAALVMGIDIRQVTDTDNS